MADDKRMQRIIVIALKEESLFHHLGLLMEGGRKSKSVDYSELLEGNGYLATHTPCYYTHTLTVFTDH